MLVTGNCTVSTTHEIEWHPPNKSLTYSDRVKERIQLLFPMSSEKEMDPENGFPSATDLIQQYQQKDKALGLKVRNKTKSFTKKEIQG